MSEKSAQQMFQDAFDRSQFPNFYQAAKAMDVDVRMVKSAYHGVFRKLRFGTTLADNDARYLRMAETLGLNPEVFIPKVVAVQKEALRDRSTVKQVPKAGAEQAHHLQPVLSCDQDALIIRLERSAVPHTEELRLRLGKYLVFVRIEPLP